MLLLFAWATVALFALTDAANAQGVTGYAEPTASASVRADSTGRVAAACPSGDVVVGGGYQLSSVGHAVVTESEPATFGDLANTQWEVVVDNTDPTGASLTVTVTAVCVSSSIAGYQEQANNVSVQSGNAAAVTASCSSGNVVVGGGFSVPSGVENFASQPTVNSNLVNNAWTTTVDNTTDVTESITTVAICVSGSLPGYEEPATQNSNLSPGSTKTVAASCAPGNVVLGGGAQVETPTFVELGSEQPSAGGNVSSTTWSASVTNVNSVAEEASVIAVCTTPAPTVSGISPQSGPAAGGATVTITGTHFTSGATVAFGTTPATNVKVLSATQITATSPSGTGVVDVTVTTAGGTSAKTNADQFRYVPSVTAVSPSAGPTAGGTSVTITGTGFVAGASVNFGGKAATNVVVNTATSITATSPAGNAGTVDVTVSTPGGTSDKTAADKYTYDPIPTVTAVDPTTGPTAGGTPVTITGSGFVNGASVAFGANAATNVNVVGATQITANAPAGSAGTVHVTVKTPGGTSATTSKDQYTYQVPVVPATPPSVTSVNPSFGPAAGGTSVTISGANLRGATAVAFGNAPAAHFTVNQGGAITATTPPGSGTVDVRVTTPGGTSAINPNDRFSYEVAPALQTSPPAVQSSTEAAFAGLVNPGNLATVAHFEYGLDSKYGATTAAVSYPLSTPPKAVGSDSSTHPVSASVSGLVPNALYHVRLVATNSAGTTFGPDETFMTFRDALPPPPILGVAVDVKVVSGLVLIKPPPGKTLGGASDRTASAALVTGRGFVPLTEARRIPAGSQIDARLGSLQVVSATGSKHRKTQAGTFGGALFQLTQTRSGKNKGLTTLSLLEGAFAGAPGYAACKKTAPDASSPTAHASRLGSRILQTLRASERRGRFSSRGRYAAATVRGTQWDTVDRCDGTLIVVHRGTVQVTDLVHHTTITVHAGHSYLAKARTRG